MAARVGVFILKRGKSSYPPKQRFRLSKKPDVMLTLIPKRVNKAFENCERFFFFESVIVRVHRSLTARKNTFVLKHCECSSR